MRSNFLVAALLTVISLGIEPTALLAQKQPVLSGTLKPGGVSSRNMELLDVVNIHPEWHDQFETIAVTYPGGGGPVTRNFIIATTEEVSGSDKKGVIRLLDVTNPRSVKSEFLKIYSNGKSSSSSTGNALFKYYQVYKDQNAAVTDTYKSDVFLIVWVGDVQVTGSTVSPPINARFMIFNLTKACSLSVSQSTNVISVNDASQRTVTCASATSNDVYLGYVRTDPLWRELRAGDYRTQSPHGLTVDAKSGLLVMTPNKVSAGFNHPTKMDDSTFVCDSVKSHIDCFDLRTLVVGGWYVKDYDSEQPREQERRQQSDV